MARPFSFAKIDIDVEAGREPRLEAPAPETPFRIVVLGDFSGRGNRGVFEPEAPRRAIEVDRDNFDEVLARLRPELHVPVTGPDGSPLRILFRDLDDFHPDRLFDRVEVFQALRQARQKLSDRETFADAAAGMRGWGKPVPPPASAPDPRLSLHDLFEQAVEATESRLGEAAASRGVDEFSSLLREIVAPHLTPRADPRQAEAIALVDKAIGSGMRACLHYPAFQALEAAWRGLFFLVRRLETGTALKLYIADMSRAEFAADLTLRDDPKRSGLYRVLVEQTVKTPGAEPWALVAGLYTFGKGPEDTDLLARMATIAREAWAPFVAGASPHIAGCASFATQPEPELWACEDGEGWSALRRLPEARWLGLALPRFLLRLPYGKQTDPIEYFAFEEMEGAPEHEAYLWANAALACVCLLGQAFSACGWGLRPGTVREIDNLPAHVYEEEGEARLKPCAEALMTERAAEALIEAGLMPLLSIKGRDAVRLGRFQSIADPPAALAGRWG